MLGLFEEFVLQGKARLIGFDGSNRLHNHVFPVADFKFAALNRVRRWENRRFTSAYSGGRLLPRTDNAGELFP